MNLFNIKPAHAIDPCDKVAIEKGSLFTDNDKCKPINDCTELQSGGGSAVEPGSLFILGDSIGDGLKGSLGTVLTTADGWTISGDTKSGRSLNEGTTVAKSAPESLKTAKTILTVLGANNVNNSSNRADIDAYVTAVKAANPTATILWLKVNVTRSDIVAGAASFNKLLSETQGITVLENSVAPPNPDGLHPDYGALSNAIASQLKGSSSQVPVTGSVADLAKQMLSSSNISYWTNNGVNTRDVVVALSEGKLAYTTAANATVKETEINPGILQFILEVAKNNKIMVNALTDKTHTSGSNHYKGLAVDIDNNPGNSADVKTLDAAAQKFGGTRNSETTHWHYDFTGSTSSSTGSPTDGTSNSAGANCVCKGLSGATSADALAALSGLPEYWRNLISTAASRYPDVDPRLVAATLWIENRGWPDPNKKWSTSSAGAGGPWQFINSSWASMGQDGDGDGIKDRNNPADAVLAAFEHQKGSAGKPIAAEFDGNPESSFQKIVFKRDKSNLLGYLAFYNGNGAPGGVALKDFPRKENADYVIMGYWLLATNFQKTWNTTNWGTFIDVGGGSSPDGSTGGGSLGC